MSDETANLKDRNAGGDTQQDKTPFLSRSASQRSISSELSHHDEQPVVGRADKGLSTLVRKLGYFNWYRIRLIAFFGGLAAIMTIFHITFKAAGVSRDRFQDYIVLKNHAFSQSGTLAFLYNYLTYRNTVVIITIINLFVMLVVMKIRLSSNERYNVNQAQKEIQVIVSSMPRQQLMDPKNPSRILVGEKYSILNKILGTKVFMTRMVRLEFFREVFTLDIIHLMLAFVTKIVFLSEASESLSNQAEAMIDFGIMSFICYKNMIYVYRRLIDKPDMGLRMGLGILIYLGLFVIKIIALQEVFAYTASLTVGLASIATGCVLYLVSDNLNDMKFVNNIRVFAFLAMFQKR